MTLFRQNKRFASTLFSDKENVAKFLVRYDLTKSIKNPFIKSLRLNYFKFGELTEKQYQKFLENKYIVAVLGDRKFIGSDCKIDPMMKKLLILNDDDFQKIDPVSKRTLMDFKEKLILNNSLSYKQMKYVGNLLLKTGLISEDDI